MSRGNFQDVLLLPEIEKTIMKINDMTETEGVVIQQQTNSASLRQQIVQVPG